MCFVNMSFIELIAFEYDAHLQKLGGQTFANCANLKSVCIPASVREICDRCFYQCRSLSVLTFEASSKLAQIGSFAFCFCRSLQFLSFPESLSLITGCELFSSGISNITVHEHNRYLKVVGLSLITIAGSVLCRYFGNEKNIIIPSGIETLGQYCFFNCQSVTTLRFDPPHVTREIGRLSFANCRSLTSVHIPASVRTLCDSCFKSCISLICVTFEAGSQLTEIQKSVFAECESLHSICIPSSVRVIGPHCFFGCTSLVFIAFEADAQITRIEYNAFLSCVLLKEIRLPSSIQFLGEGWGQLSSDRSHQSRTCFTRVRFGSAKSLFALIEGGMITLPPPFEIEVENWDTQTPIPGCFAEASDSPNVFRLRKESTKEDFGQMP
jgi:hypothetical protein